MTDIILFSDQVWDRVVPTNRQQVAARLPDHLDCRVVYVESPSFMASPALSIGRYNDGYHFVEPDRERISASVTRIAERVWTVSPLLPLPHRYAKAVPGLVFGAVRWFARRACERLRIINPLVWSYSPFGAAYLPQAVDPRGFVFDCVDRYDRLEYYTDYDVDVARRQSDTLNRADVVFVSSDTLYERFQETHPNVHLTGNAADIDLFRSARPGGAAPPAPELQEVSGPIIGFYGLLTEYKLDFELLRMLAERRPDVTLVLIGPEAEPLPGWIESSSNVIRFPRIPQRDLPGYITVFDLCLLPYEVNEYTSGIEPLKLYEYLAAEKPVVATDFSNLPTPKEWLRIAGSRDEFVDLVDEVLADPPEEFDLDLESHDWDAKIQKMLEVVRRKRLLDCSRTQSK